MLLENMTPKEMMEEMHKDYDELCSLNMRFLLMGGFKHLRKKGAKFPAYIMKEQHTSRGNRYLCDLLFRGKEDVFTLNVRRTYLAILETSEGMAGLTLAFSCKYKQEILYIYRPHVFKRYRERMHLDKDGVELIKYFDKRNCDAILHDDYQHNEGDKENDFMLTIQDGALFGTKCEQDGCIYYLINTFIANDTMQEGYKSKFNNTHNDTVDRIKNTLEAYGCDTDYSFDYKKRK